MHPIAGKALSLDPDCGPETAPVQKTSDMEWLRWLIEPLVRVGTLLEELAGVVWVIVDVLNAVVGEPEDVIIEDV